jgi:hypothetical protein
VPRVEFEADSEEQLVSLAWRWVMGPRRVAGPNKVMRRVARRDLITWDGYVRGYRMDPADAEIVLERWPSAQEAVSVPRGSGPPELSGG